MLCHLPHVHMVHRETGYSPAGLWVMIEDQSGMNVSSLRGLNSISICKLICGLVLNGIMRTNPVY